MTGDVGGSVVAHWRGDGVLTVLALACWCQKRRDLTINMGWKGYRGGRAGSVTKDRSAVVIMGG